MVRPRALVATAAAACGSRSPAAACGIRACVGGAMRVRRTAGAAGHASQTLSKLSERTARSHTQRSECVPHVSTTTLAHRQRHGALAGWCGEGWWERWWRGWGRSWASCQGAAYGLPAAQHASVPFCTLSGRMAQSESQEKARPSPRPMRQRGLSRAARSRIGRTVFDGGRVVGGWVRDLGHTGVPPAPGGARWVGRSGLAACCGAWVRWTRRRPW